jgi:magnesium-transporting ATPase (P-type)
MSVSLQVRDLTREHVESELQFVGFVIIACPLKMDSKNVIKQIQESSHHVCSNLTECCTKISTFVL